MSDIAPGDLTLLLEALDEQLAERDAHEHLVVIGGSGLVAMGLASRATRDVDVVGLLRDGSLRVAEPLPDVVRKAAAAVARDFRLADGWLNAGPTSLITTGSGLPDGFLERARTVIYGPALSVTFASRVDQIHFKLYALADRGLARDEADLRGLDPSQDELTAAARWVRSHNAPGPFDDQITRTLEGLGAVDVGRDR